MQNFTPGTASDGVRVYVAGDVGPSQVSGYYEHRVLGLTVGTGASSWQYNRGSYGWDVSAPSVGNGQVYIQFSGHSGISGGNPTQYPYMVGVNATTAGQTFATDYAAQWGYANQPTVAGNQVAGHAGYYGGMKAYNGTTGTQNWSITNLPQQTHYIPAADATHLYVYMGEASASPGPSVGTFYAINRTTGAITYTITNPLDDGRMFALAQNVVLGGQNDAIAPAIRDFFANQYEVLSFDLVSRNIRWRVPYRATGVIAVADGKVVVPSGDRLRVLDQATGAELWSWNSPTGHNLSGNVLLTENLAFVSSQLETFAVDLETRQQVWSAPFAGTLSWGGGEGVLIISNGSRVTAFFAPVPEPAGLLALAGLVGIGWRTVRRRAG
jgi:hypothetical protein